MNAIPDNTAPRKPKRRPNFRLLDTQQAAHVEALAAAKSEAASWRKWALYFAMPLGFLLGAFVHLVVARLGA